MRPGRARASAAPTASLLLVNGRILTMAGGGAEALAVRGDRILAVGRERDLSALRGPETVVVDLHGRLALPGFTDSHVHLRPLGRMLSQVDLASAATLAAALRRVAARVRRTPKGHWITGAGFDKNRWGEAFPDRHDLDPVAPDHPVVLHSRDGHSVWANSLALRKCGISRATKAPPGGVIIRDAAGQPTGIFQERAIALIRACRSFEEADRGEEELVAGLRSLVRYGITSVHAMEESETFGDLERLKETGKLPLRVAIYRPAADLEALIGAGVRSGFGDEWLRIGGVKLLVDGSLGSQTAWLFEPYERPVGQERVSCPPAPAVRGVPVLHGKDLRHVVGSAAEAGLACAIHAIGDRANAEALDALERVRAFPTPLPHRIEHAQLLRPSDIPRFAQLGIVASMQPCHIPGDIDPAERYWGKRSRWAYPVRSLLRAGASVIFGSDAPVETADVMFGLCAAVRRQTRDGRPPAGWYRREERVGRLAALRAYTVEPAKATAEAGLKGKLLPGYLADIVVLSEDILHIPLRNPRLSAGADSAAPAGMRPRVALVLVGGRIRLRRRSE